MKDAPITDSDSNVWEECAYCGGLEGWYDSLGEFEMCERCEGQGGYWRADRATKLTVITERQPDRREGGE